MEWSRSTVRNKRLISAIALIGLLLIIQARFRLALVIGESMRPGLRTGELLLVDKKAYRSAEPQRGDIVLAPYDKELIVKPVVGLPGEEVAVTRGHLLVNGSAIAERHAIEPGPLEITPGRLARDKFALMGDNRAMGVSQNVHAVVAKEQILGKVVWALPLSILLSRG